MVKWLALLSLLMISGAVNGMLVSSCRRGLTVPFGLTAMRPLSMQHGTKICMNEQVLFVTQVRLLTTSALQHGSRQVLSWGVGAASSTVLLGDHAYGMASHLHGVANLLPNDERNFSHTSRKNEHRVKNSSLANKEMMLLYTSIMHHLSFLNVAEYVSENLLKNSLKDEGESSLLQLLACLKERDWMRVVYDETNHQEVRVQCAALNALLIYVQEHARFKNELAARNIELCVDTVEQERS